MSAKQHSFTLTEGGWAFRERIGIKPNLKTADEYITAIEDGWKHAKQFLQENQKSPYFDSHGISKVHWLIFKDVLTWAGEFRKSEQGFKDAIVSEPQLILSDLRSLHLQSRGWFSSPNVERTAKEIAAFNAGLRAIEPFFHGTASVARIVSEHQAFIKYERPIDLQHDLKVYHVSVEQARKGNLTPLANQILEHAGLSRAVELQRIEKTIESATEELRERDYRSYGHY